MPRKPKPNPFVLPSTDAPDADAADSSAVPSSGSRRGLEPLERREGETQKAYAAFKAYCKLGPDRTYLRTAFDIGKGPDLVKQWACKNGWRERARVFDTRMAEVERVQQERVRAEFAERWERRRLESCEANWDRAQRLAVRAEEMLKAPLFEQQVTEWGTHKDGERYPIAVVLEPAKWTFATAGAILKLAAELQAAALGEALGGQDDGFDPTTATPDECRAYLAKAGVIKALPAPLAAGAKTEGS